MSYRRLVVCFLSLLALASARALDDAGLRETLAVMGPLLGHRWLEKQGLGDYLLRQSWRPDSSGLRCVGRWSYGPSLKVSLRVAPDDTVICLTRGSGASLVRFRSQDSVTLDLLGDVNFAGIPRRAVIQDTLVVAGIHSGGTGLEVHGISDPSSPNLLSRVNLPVVNDIAVNDTFAYVACEDDSLRIFSIADPRNPRRLGACRDSCDLFMAQAGGYCYLVYVSGVHIVDVRNPANPHRVGRIGGGEPLAVHVRDTLAYVTVYQYGLRIYDVGDPATPRPLGSLTGPDALDITMAATCDTVAYTPVLDVISVANPAQPRLLGHASIPASYEYGVAVVPALGHALVANYTDGVVAVDLRIPTAPVVDTMAFAAGPVVDVDVKGGTAYLACTFAGLVLLDVTDPAAPGRLGGVDLAGEHPSCHSAVAGDSFAYMHWYLRPQFQSVDVSDPRRPRLAGGCDVTNPPEDMVLRDSFVYCAEASRFQIVNVARPREPRLVGSCVIQDGVFGLALEDSLAYVAGTSLQILSVADPANPRVLCTGGRPSIGVAVSDTFAYVPSWDTLFVFSVANPSQPRELSRTPTGRAWDVALGDSLLFIGTGVGVEAYDVSDPVQPRFVGAASAPYSNRRLCYAGGHLYGAFWDAGVVVYETSATGMAEQQPGHASGFGLSVRPNPARGRVVLAGVRRSVVRVRVFDAAGRCVENMTLGAGKRRADGIELDAGNLSAGVYFLEAELDDCRKATTRFVKQ